MKPSELIIGVIFAVLIIMATIPWITNNVGQDVINDPQYKTFNKSFNKVDNITQTQAALQATLSTESGSTSLLGALDALIQTSWGTIKLIPNYLSFVNDMLISAGGIIGLDKGFTSVVVTLLWAALIIGVIFAILAAIFQKDL